ncbi:hypothetical protein Rhe02_62740 [Rhizocola hellebori]|uniref:Nitroreductase domain-containing protein n=1 Tax=Rhizocola hellebori TaxID=1392758 RepID=A0A8J3QDU7_9ACTN|nr:SagB/ThcOx family dehydrogenase [Rhizocola hellebori]GIH08207.1 hypothetical protein Rhe02_62740 [Rhizocola hellebori]
MVVRLNPAVRLIPPSEVIGDHWMAENLLERKRYKVSRRTAATLAAACRPQDPEMLAKRLAEVDTSGESVWVWEKLIASLCERGLIVDAATIDDDPQLAWFVNLRKSWSRFGWHEAAEYHALSFDYPCMDYSEAAAFLADQARMRGYQADEPDTDRFKLEYLDRPGVSLPEPETDIPTMSARTAWADHPEPAVVDFESLSKVVSLSFGAIGAIIPRTDSAPLLRRSSPSGGGRNPSEGYVIVRDVPGLEPGWYHITMRPFSLRRLDGPQTDEQSLMRLFPETLERFPFPIKALVVITSMFERNMYRYREPRTFRTVHMDAGHIASSMRISARSLGLVGGIFYCDIATAIEQALGLDGMAEGYMLTVALADGIA